MHWKKCFPRNHQKSSVVWIIREEWFNCYSAGREWLNTAYGELLEWKIWRLFHDVELYLVVQLEELRKMAINFSLYSWNPELEFKAGIYGIQVGTTPNCSVLKSRGTNFEHEGYPIWGKDSKFPRNMAPNLAESCTIRAPCNSYTSTLKPLQRIKWKNNVVLSRAIARQLVINPHNLLRIGVS